MAVGTCATCSNPAKYKCPRCATPSCSLKCNRAHKEATECSGIRDPAQFIPAKDYGYQALMSDYTYLEDVQRKVGLAHRERSDLHRDSRKVPRWVAEAGQLGLTVTLLGEGMQRRKENKSSWVPGSRTLNLTLTFKLHIQGTPEPIGLTTPTNPSTSSLQELLKKPFIDGRAARVLSKEQLKSWRDHLQSIRFFLLQEEDPRRVAAMYKPPQASKPPTPSPPPPSLSQAQSQSSAPRDPHAPLKLHPSLPARPNFALGLESLQQNQIAAAAPMTLPKQPAPEPLPHPPPSLPSVAPSLPHMQPTHPVTVIPPQPTMPPPPPPPPSITPAKRALEKETQIEPETRPKIIYAELDATQPLIDQLKGLQVIEWPVFDCYLHSGAPTLSASSTENQLDIKINPPRQPVTEDRVPVQKAVKVDGVGLADGYGSNSEDEGEEAGANVDGESLQVQELLVPR